MRLLFIPIYCILFISPILSQEGKLYDSGYKDFTWSLSTNEIDSIVVANNFHLDRWSPDSYTVTENDKKTNIDYIKEDSKVKYKYEFNFINDSLFQTTIKIETTEDDNYPLLREIEKSFSKDLLKSYGKPNDEDNIDEMDRVIHSATWLSNKVNIHKYYNEKRMEFFGGYVTNIIVFELKITDKNKNIEIEKRIKIYQVEKQKKANEDAKIKAKSIRDKF
jgi:hypothetical protein